MNLLTELCLIRIRAIASLIIVSTMLITAHSAQALPIEIEVEPEVPTETGQPDNPPIPSLPALSSAKSAIVLDLNSGEVLGAKSPDQRLPMASTTKIMTALLVLEDISRGNLNLNTMITISQSAGTMGDVNQNERSAGSVMGDFTGTGQDRSVGLSPGDTVSINDLLYGLLLDSGNDAAIALAEAVAGSEKAFVERMNVRAQQLRLSRTRFANPHGRDPLTVDKAYCECASNNDTRCHHFSSARDLARLASTALNNVMFSAIVSTRIHNATSWSPRNRSMVDTSLENSNLQIRTDRDDHSFAYPGAFGVKTGKTDRAGRCLVSAADSTRNTSHSVLVVVLGASSNTDRYTDAALLLDHGFTVLESRTPHNPIQLPINTPTTVGIGFN